MHTASPASADHPVAPPMNLRILYWAITSALAGFIFGFDTVVISGAEQTIQKLWGLSPGMHGFAMGAALYGTVIGSLIGGWPTDHWGRKPTLIAIGLLYVISAVGCGFAWDVWSFIIARFLGGVGIGVSTVTAPLYISEIAPPAHRGRLAGMFQFNIVFGILVAFASNALLAGIGENAWRWMLGVAAFPSLAYMFMCFGLPESPRWLLTRKGDRDQGLRVLGLIEPKATSEELRKHADEIVAAAAQQTSAEGFWSGRLRVPILLAFLVAFFNQLSGINAILYFAPRIFGLTGSENALQQSIGIGVVNLIFTFVGLWLIDRLGRRTLLTIGSFGYILSLGLCAVAFFTWAPQFKVGSKAVELRSIAKSLEVASGATKEPLTREFKTVQKELETATANPSAGTESVHFAPDATVSQVTETAGNALKQASSAAGFGGVMVVVCILAFIAAHAIGQGTVIWVLISEIFPNKYRATGQALGSATHWVFAALLTTFFPAMVNAFPPGYVFLFFCFMMVLQLIWVKTMVPETKGVPLEEIQKKLGVEA